MQAAHVQFLLREPELACHNRPPGQIRTRQRNHLLPKYIFFGCRGWEFPGGSDGKESTCNAGDPSSISEAGRSPGKGNGNQLSILARKIPWTEEPGRQQSEPLTPKLHPFFSFKIKKYKESKYRNNATDAKN